MKQKRQPAPSHDPLPPPENLAATTFPSPSPAGSGRPHRRADRIRAPFPRPSFPSPLSALMLPPGAAPTPLLSAALPSSSPLSSPAGAPSSGPGGAGGGRISSPPARVLLSRGGGRRRCRSARQRSGDPTGWLAADVVAALLLGGGATWWCGMAGGASPAQIWALRAPSGS
ncbi:hypothetical protein ACQJBY_005757 [Aegilops geniculata]